MADDERGGTGSEVSEVGELEEGDDGCVDALDVDHPEDAYDGGEFTGRGIL